jgi:transposase-like protein
MPEAVNLQIIGLNKHSIRKYLEDEINRFVKWMIEAIFKAELESYIGRKPYERSGGIKVYRNGYRHRQLLTRWCNIKDLQVPRLRAGRYRYKLLSENKISEEEVVKMIIQIWVQGCSYRDLKTLIKKIYGLELSLMSFSRMMINYLEKYISSYRNKPIDKKYDWIYIDGLEIGVKEFKDIQTDYIKRRRKNAVVLLVLGQRREGRKVLKEIIGYRIARSEDEASYRELLNDLKRRGLGQEQYGLVIHDGAASISAALRNVYGAGRIKQQLCLVHIRRNILSAVVDPRNKEELSKDIWRVYGAPTRGQFLSRHNQVFKKWISREPQAMEGFKNIDERMLTKYYFDETVHRQIHSSNSIERRIGEIKRRIKVIGNFETLRSAEILIFCIIEYLNQYGGLMPSNPNLVFTH